MGNGVARGRRQIISRPAENRGILPFSEWTLATGNSSRWAFLFRLFAKDFAASLMACTPALGPFQPIMLSFSSSKLVRGDEEQARQVAGMVRGTVSVGLAVRITPVQPRLGAFTEQACVRAPTHHPTVSIAPGSFGSRLR